MSTIPTKTVCYVFKPACCATQMKSGRDERGRMWIRFINSADKSGCRVINVINVSVTESFRGTYSERGSDTDNYDSDKCQEYDLCNCYAALMNSREARLFHQQQWGLTRFFKRVTLRPVLAASSLDNKLHIHVNWINNLFSLLIFLMSESSCCLMTNAQMQMW